MKWESKFIHQSSYHIDIGLSRQHILRTLSFPSWITCHLLWTADSFIQQLTWPSPCGCLKHTLKLKGKTKLLYIVPVFPLSFPFQETVKLVAQDKNLEPFFTPFFLSQGKLSLLTNLADIFKIHPELHCLSLSPLLSDPIYHYLLPEVFH